MYFKPGAIWPDRCPSAEDRGVGVRHWPSVKIWPPSGGQLADLISAHICLGRWMRHSRSSRKPGCCCYIGRGPRHRQRGGSECSPFLVRMQLKSIWILLECPDGFVLLVNSFDVRSPREAFTLNMTLIFTHYRSPHPLYGLWSICSGWQGCKGLGSSARGGYGDKNVRLTTHLWSTTSGDPDTNITAPAAQHDLVYKQPVDQQIRYLANSCPVGSID